MATANISTATASAIFTQSCGATCYDSTLKLYQSLNRFLSANYSTTIIPKSPSIPLNVGVFISLTSILELSTDGKLSVLLALILTWTDYKLKWSPAEYSGVNYLYLETSSIWTPSLTVVNPYSGGTTDVNFTDFAYVSNNGTVQVLESLQLDTSCDLDLTYFPYDTQTCQIAITNLLYSSSDFQFVVYTPNASVASDANNADWTLQWTAVSTANESFVFSVEGNQYVTFSVLLFSIALERQPLYYVTNIYIPTFVMVILVALVFLLPAESGEKVSFAATMMLALYAFQQVVAGLLPQTDALPNLSTALLFCFVLSAITCITSVVSVLMRSITGDLSTGKRRKVIRCMGRILGYQRPDLLDSLRKDLRNEKLSAILATHNEINEQQQPETALDDFKQLLRLKKEKRRARREDRAKEHAWKMIDFLFNFIMLILYCIASIVYIVIYV